MANPASIVHRYGQTRRVCHCPVRRWRIGVHRRSVPERYKRTVVQHLSTCPITTDAIDSASSKVRRSMVFIDVMLDVMLALEGFLVLKLCLLSWRSWSTKMYRNVTGRNDGSLKFHREEKAFYISRLVFDRATCVFLLSLTTTHTCPPMPGLYSLCPSIYGYDQSLTSSVQNGKCEAATEEGWRIGHLASRKLHHPI
jgi:hypothetical protein